MGRSREQTQPLGYFQRKGSSIYGKLFASLFTGSMFGAGPEVFAVWAYAIANKNADQEVELNSVFLAAVIGCSEGAIRKAFDYLTGPDKRSRSSDENGRRLIQVDAMRYRLVNGEKYDRIVNREARKEQNRKSQQRFREKASISKRKRPVSRRNQKSAPVAVALAVSVNPLDGKITPSAAPQKRGARVIDVYSQAFEETWKVYPKRPNNSKADAWRQWKARIAEGVHQSVLITGTIAYAEHCEREGTEPRYIKQAATFYGRGRHFETDYTPVAHEPSEEDLLRKATPEQRRHIARIEALMAEDAAAEAR